MKALILTFGTKGDIEPYIALGRALKDAGHDATIGTAWSYEDDVRALGVDFIPSNSLMLEVMQDALGSMAGPADLQRAAKAMTRGVRVSLDDQLRAVRSTKPDIIVYHPKCLGAPHLAEHLGIPAVLSLPLPFYTPTSSYPVPFIPRDLGPRLNRWSYGLNRAESLMYGGITNDFRHKLGLSSLTRWADPLLRPDGGPLDILYPYSRHVVPVPADYPATAHVTGYWFTGRGASWEPPQELKDFLAAGEAPMYIGFGSMGFGQGAEQRGEAITWALRSTGIRAIVATGWGGVATESSDDVLVIDSAPHDWLFPRVSAVVHHGGAGTTGIGLASGRPSLVCPFLGDQSFWANRVHELGAGPAPLPRAKITARALAERFTDLVETECYRSGSALLAQRISTESGTEQAVEILQRLA
ncbi:glycosyltransferase [Brevibacterium aurantiacum]|uniref:Glycosyltransferase family 1 protein n=1 Tax=Brevibacterium aurantiacum TaxID=273384 RepID=A0A556CC22_BREAU|nr:glycosyltransferase [Brevibacterium aurantiacum]TSI14994.1 glycosyltransferase family 1 protein [Brevibacterium aurantiacum]